MVYKIYTKDNYFVIQNTTNKEFFYGIKKNVEVDPSNIGEEEYRFFNIKDWNSKSTIKLSNILKEDGSPYIRTEWDKFWQENTGNFNSPSLGADIHTNAVSKVTVKLAENINKGQAVYVSGANGTNILISKASNSTEATSSKTLGLLEATGITNDILNVVTEGLLTGLDTSLATIGDAVWLGTNGNLIYGLTNKPHAPAHLVYIGIVTRVNINNGEIFVKSQNGFELDELHDVLITNPQNGEVIQRDGNLWLNKQIIEDSIIEGITDKAPSQNIVFDGLSSKLSNNIDTYPPATLPIADTTPLLVNENGVWKKVNKSDIITGGGGTGGVWKQILGFEFFYFITINPSSYVGYSPAKNVIEYVINLNTNNANAIPIGRNTAVGLINDNCILDKISFIATMDDGNYNNVDIAVYTSDEYIGTNATLVYNGINLTGKVNIENINVNIPKNKILHFAIKCNTFIHYTNFIHNLQIFFK